jgi:hypothetical protein
MLKTESGRLLESPRDLQNAEVVAITAGDLNADGQTLISESCGYGD